MFDANHYQLLDFGEGRKLERFGSLILNRVCPVATRDRVSNRAAWQQCHFRYKRRDEGQGQWLTMTPLPPELGEVDEKGLPFPWQIRHRSVSLEVRLTPAGQVGLFPEQAGNWDWLKRRVESSPRPLKVLNLFAYTGGSTLAAAAAGAEVVHVDGARNIVEWARRNARVSGLEGAPIRWICEDCLTFVRREIKRGNEYDAVIMDPPSYGHGPDGQRWKIEQHLGPLLDACGEITRNHRRFMLVTCHSPAFGPAELHALLADRVLGSCQQGGYARSLDIECVDGRSLPSGVVAHWPG